MKYSQILVTLALLTAQISTFCMNKKDYCILCVKKKIDITSTNKNLFILEKNRTPQEFIKANIDFAHKEENWNNGIPKAVKKLHFKREQEKLEKEMKELQNEQSELLEENLKLQTANTIKKELEKQKNEEISHDAETDPHNQAQKIINIIHNNKMTKQEIQLMLSNVCQENNVDGFHIQYNGDCFEYNNKKKNLSITNNHSCKTCKACNEISTSKANNFIYEQLRNTNTLKEKEQILEKYCTESGIKIIHVPSGSNKSCLQYDSVKKNMVCFESPCIVCRQTPNKNRDNQLIPIRETK